MEDLKKEVYVTVAKLWMAPQFMSRAEFEQLKVTYTDKKYLIEVWQEINLHVEKECKPPKNP
tara:strand:+ start:111 stop:296 length:186 start_codon:yes stop_codon:yes gene_type:complete